MLLNPAFMRFLVARAGATTSQQMLMLAISWHMYSLTASAWDLGLVGLCQFLPGIATTLVAGHCADRMHRARLVAVCMALQAALSMALVSMTMHQQATREVLLAISLLLGAVRPFQMAAQQSLLPMLVAGTLLARATALSTTVQQISIIAGPALGGLLFAAGINISYISCVVLLCTSAVLYASIRYDHVAPPREPVTAKTMLAGLHFIGSRPVLLGAISLDLFAVLFGGATALLPIYADQILHVGPQGLGALRAAPAAGAFVIGLLLSRRGITRRVGVKLLAAAGIYGLCMIGFGLSRWFPLSLLILMVAGAADTISVVVRQTLVALETPDHMRGRVAAVNSLFIGASNQLGEFESGATAALFGTVGSVVAGGVATVLVSLAWGRLFVQLLRRDGFEEARAA